ncbi:MAG: glycosyltransferase family 2 protein [Bacteroidia bacterium]|nr:glycosyltransferase family 2 protein [Bacteroidia bacterium]
MNGLSIIIPTYKREQILHQTLEALLPELKKLSFPTEVIVVNDDPDQKPALQAGSLSGIKLLNHSGKGVAGARNTGAYAASGTHLLFMDDDHLVKAENLQRTWELLQLYPRRVYGPNWIYPPELSKRLVRTRFGRFLIRNGFTTLKGWRHDLNWDDHTPFRCEHIASSYFPMAKDLFMAAGGYDTDFPFAGFEDRDFANRVSKAGLELYIDPLNMIYHNEADRVEPLPWLERKRRSAVTRKIAVLKGIPDAVPEFGAGKKLLYRVFGLSPRLLLFAVRAIPPLRLLDPLYFRGINLLLGVYHFKGFNS